MTLPVKRNDSRIRTQPRFGIRMREPYCLASGIAVDEWIQEVGAGMNFKRKKFLNLMDEIVSGEVKRLIVAHNGRLVRFGFDFIDHLAQRHGCEIEVINQESLSPQEERNDWASDPYLARMMRRYWNRGHNHTHNHTHNQIVVGSDNYSTFQLNGKAWVKIPGLEKGKRIAISLNTTVEPTGTLRIILRDTWIEIHHAIDVEQTNDCGSEVIGVDKGYTEAFADSDGDHHALGLGELLRSESDYLKLKNQRRAKHRALAKNTQDETKRQRIF